MILGADGAEIAALGDVDAPIFPRSSAKPLQTVGMLRAGLPVSDAADLAVIAASHHGEPVHVRRVRALLAAGGLSDSDLACPPDLPLDREARHALLAAGGGPAPIYMNCSGKHTGMLLTCRAAGWPIEGYRDPAHPLQTALRATMEEATGTPAAATGVDGCGAPVHAFSLRVVAAAYLRLLAAAPGTAEHAVVHAMRAHPQLVSGTHGDDAKVMRAVPGALSKAGAEGVAAVAVPDAGAIAVKIDDGAGRARLPVVTAALARLGVRTPGLDALAEQPVFGGGARVGAVRASAALRSGGRGEAEGSAGAGDVRAEDVRTEST